MADPTTNRSLNTNELTTLLRMLNPEQLCFDLVRELHKAQEEASRQRDWRSTAEHNQREFIQAVTNLLRDHKASLPPEFVATLHELVEKAASKVDW